MNNQKSLFQCWHEDYDWQTVTDNFNQRKIIETIENMCDNAAKKYLIFVCITSENSFTDLNLDFCSKWSSYYQQQQLKELLEGRDVALDYHEILNGIDQDSYEDFMYTYAEWLQKELITMYENQGQFNGGTFHVDNINNYGYISDILNQHNNKKKK